MVNSRNFHKRNLVKRAIQSIAKDRGYSKTTYWKVTNAEIFRYMKSHGHDRMFTELGIKSLRRGLAKMYREKNGD